MPFITSGTVKYGIQILDAHETYEEFILEHPTGSPGDAHLVGTHLYSWNEESQSWVDAGVIVGEDGPQGDTGPQGIQGIQGIQGEPGVDGIDGDPLDFLAVPSNIVPASDNDFTLGTPDNRWAGIHVGPGTIYITDKTLLTDAELTVDNGVLQIDGANQLQVGDLKFVDNTIESTLESTNIQVGLTSSSGDILLNRNTRLYEGKDLTFGDDTVQSTAYIVPTDTTFVVAGGTTGTQPTFTGSPLFAGSYVKSGDLVTFRIKVLMTNITNFGTGQYYVDLPLVSKYDYKMRGGCLHDISTGKDYEIGGHVSAGASRLFLSSVDTQSGSVFDVPFEHNNPITLNSADNFHISGTYIV